MTTAPFNCNDTWPLLLEYLDKAVTPERRAAIELHLQDCLHCRSAAELQRLAKELVAAQTAPGPPAELTARIKRSLNDE